MYTDYCEYMFLVSTVTLFEFSSFAAILLGPILAVQVQALLDRRREFRRRKNDIFGILMATRGARLSPQHVQALNSIDVVFYSRSPKDKLVRNAWREYLDSLSGADTSRRETLFVSLLEKMAESLGYEFDRTSLKNQAYSPQGHFDLELDATAIRKGLVEMMEGKRALRMAVEPATEPPFEQRPIPKLGNDKR